MPYFTKEKDKTLISLVKSKPFLYKPSAPGYKDQLAKSMAWEEISDKLEIPLPAIRRRWKYIKDHCRKKSAQAELQNDIDPEIDLRDRMYRKKINGKWCMVILPSPEEDHDDKVDKTGNSGLKQENNTTKNNSNKSYFFDDTDDSTDLSDIEDRKCVNVSKYQKNGIVIKNLDKRKDLVPTSDSFDALGSKRKKLMDDLKQKHGRGTNVEKIIAQHMETLKIINEIDGIQNLNGKKRKIMSNNREEYYTKFESNGESDFDNKTKNINNSIMDIYRQKIGLFLTKMKKYKRISNINPENSPMHKFFEEAASIVTMFPPELAFETSLMIYREVIDKEM